MKNEETNRKRSVDPKMEAMHRAPSPAKENSNQHKQCQKWEVSCKLKNKQNTKIEKEVMAKSLCQFFIRAAEKFLEGGGHVRWGYKEEKTE